VTSITSTTKILIFIVAYNAEEFISSVLTRIPPKLWQDTNIQMECLIIDDSSKDHTFEVALDYARQHPDLKLTVLYNPINQGYGGNQKLGYQYAIQHGFDIVILLHGDGQYAPELLGEMIDPIRKGDADVVLGSRMLNKQAALEGGMPIYKWIGNQALTTIQNGLLGSKLAEFHTGYRAYRVSSLASVPFTFNSNYFDFDTDILIQMMNTQKRIQEITVPTFYGDEISHVNSWRYGILILWTTLVSRLIRVGLYYHPKFDYEQENTHYTEKFGYLSSHQFAIDHITEGSTVLDIGCGPGFMARKLAEKQVKTISLDLYIQEQTRQASHYSIEADLQQYEFHDPYFSSENGQQIKTILLLDILEHLKSPELVLSRIRSRFGGNRPEVIITTANIAFLPVRMSLLLGQFNYGKKGILDLDHARLFTFRSMRRILEITGYEIVEERGIPVPFPLVFKNQGIINVLTLINQFFIWIARGVFSYQIALRVRPYPTLDYLLQSAEIASQKRKSEWETLDKKQ
jgi:glycosyltransferase involved in cell wall biosynthesis